MHAVKMLDNETDESIYLGDKIHYSGNKRRHSGHAY